MTEKYLEALASLTLRPERSMDALSYVSGLSEEQRSKFVAIANSNHVVVRAFRALRQLSKKNAPCEIRHWVEHVLTKSESEIVVALDHLEKIDALFENESSPLVVLKSLDHWPDIGNDLDLYTCMPEEAVRELFTSKLNARLKPQSWGDRLAKKLNFVIPELPKDVEVHVGRLGQTGEHVRLAERFISRSRKVSFGDHTFRLPAPEERVLAATLQRMYRHLFFRVADIANTARMVDAGEIDFAELESAARQNHVWPGVRDYLNIISDRVASFRSTSLNLPASIRAGWRNEHSSRMFVGGRFLRLPIVPLGTSLYASQLGSTVLDGEFKSAFRLGLLPPLAAAAMVAFKLTGSNKGVW